MKINRMIFLNLLNIMKPIVSESGILDINKKFIFIKNKGIVVSNDKEMIFYKFDIDFDCVVFAEPIFKLLNNINEEEYIEILREDNFLFMKSKFLNMTLNCMEYDISFINIILKNIEKISWEKIPENFFKGIRLNIFSTSSSFVHPVLNCIHVNKNLIMSSDNFRITQFVMNNIISNPLLIPLSSAKEFIKLKKMNFYGIYEGWLYMKSENFYFCCRIMEGQYPSISQFFTIEGDKISIPIEFKKIIEISSVMTGDEDFEKKVTIWIKNGYIYCEGKCASGDIQGKSAIKYKKKIEFQINPKFLLDILDITNELIYTENYVMFFSENFKHLISLYEKEEK